MSSYDVTDKLSDFSKHLLVTVFAIFAFTSGPLLGTSNVYVKIAYMASLLFSLIGMSYGFKGVLVKINYYIENEIDESSNDLVFPVGKLGIMKHYVQWQYIWTLVSLLTLMVTIGLHFMSNNYMNVLIRGWP